MSAYAVYEPGGPAMLRRVELPTPEPRPGWVTIEVKAFGLNRSEMFTRQGHSPSVRFPRVLGIEGVGIVVEPSDSRYQRGDRVAALMGGMGREFDGSYAEYMQVPSGIVVPLDVELDWAVLGALPEMFQTAWGSLHRGLRIEPRQTLLIRGATSSVGLMALAMAKSQGLAVIGSTRSPAKEAKLRAAGADAVLLDDGEVAPRLRESYADGVDGVLELVGTKTLLDSLQCCRLGGTVCMTGILGNEWRLPSFTPMEDIPHTARLTVYSGGPADLDRQSFNDFLCDVADDPSIVPIDTVFDFDKLVEAHEYMESNRAQGKLVVVI